ncbi:hypothetical protein AVEN_88001-1 [Araneus ventricosus]|uniref:Uncharacterized protein n=1 Tax=Araneus ventricosus TaxID=182803 RepID=A0A4Y2FZ66_ARAVE|nr:hypothetical protein AVEN_88001-1 [Araneus ventricosus]
MAESEDDDFGSFQRETDVEEVEKVTYLELSVTDFSTNMYILIDNIRGARMNVHYSYICRIPGVECGEVDAVGLRSTNLAKSKFVLVATECFQTTFESQLITILAVTIFEVASYYL